jgi:hypothetical protein
MSTIDPFELRAGDELQALESFGGELLGKITRPVDIQNGPVAGKNKERGLPVSSAARFAS